MGRFEVEFLEKGVEGRNGGFWIGLVESGLFLGVIAMVMIPRVMV